MTRSCIAKMNDTVPPPPAVPLARSMRRSTTHSSSPFPPPKGSDGKGPPSDSEIFQSSELSFVDRLMGLYQQIRSKLSRNKSRWPSSAAWPLQDHCSIPAIHKQTQSLFFSALASELRVLIYQAVLGDPERLLHICVNGKCKKGRRAVAHWRCSDLDSSYPTWQHTCFGEELVVIDCVTCRPRLVTTTNDQLSALLLVCRKTYSESLAILYQENTFHFRGGLGLPAFKESIPALQWKAIRRIEIATSYCQFYHGNLAFQFQPPASLPNWFRICECLEELPNLEVLRFEVKAYDPTLGFPVLAEPGVQLSILAPLAKLKSKIFDVELNITVLDEVLEKLGPVNFTLTFNERPENTALFRASSLHDAMDLPPSSLAN